MFPSLTASKFNKTLKRVMVEAGFPNGSRYSPRCFRSRRRKNCWYWAVLRTPSGLPGDGAGWASAVISILNNTGALKIPRPVATVSDLKSDDEDTATVRLEADGKLRKTLRKFTGCETCRR